MPHLAQARRLVWTDLRARCSVQRWSGSPVMPVILIAFWGIAFGVTGSAFAGGGSAANPVRGVIRPIRQATIATDAPLRTIELPFRESERFKLGDTLALFDCRRQKADLDAASAALREASLNLDSNIQLDRFQAVGKNDVGITRARADKALADVAGLEAKMDECKLIAPFNGRITELSIRLHERTVPQHPYIAIIDDSQLEIELIAPASMLSELQPGAPFAFRVDELGGRMVDASVARLGAGVDPVSKTVKVIGTIRTQDSSILSGMSGTANFAIEGKP